VFDDQLIEAEMGSTTATAAWRRLFKLGDRAPSFEDFEKDADVVEGDAQGSRSST